MKRITLFFFCMISLHSISQTQLEMNEEAHQAYKEADRELNQVYKKVLNNYASDTAFVARLKSAQRLWVSFRDAELAMQFPAEDKYLQYGSVYPMCVAYFLKEMTETRTEKLRSWLIGGLEGETCLGSLKMLSSVGIEHENKAIIHPDSSVSLYADMHKDYRIFAYNQPHWKAKKVLLFSIFTDEVENNPFLLQYGAYYGTDGMKGIDLKYQRTVGDFVEVACLENQKIIDFVYIDKLAIRFEK